MVNESHVQGIARFVVGFGTEEDYDWRDYHFDFCGHIKYDPATGVPVEVKPVDNSGYSLGCLQLDFGQTTAAAEPFVAAFDAWHRNNPGSKGLVSAHDFAVGALKKNGHTLKAHPASALRRQDVEALSEFVLSPDGSDWVNNHIDNALIGSDQQKKSIYSSEWTLAGIAREMEARAAFKSAEAAKNTAKTDLLYAMTMKAYNQAPGYCIGDLLPFLDEDPSDDEIAAWPGQQKFPKSFRDGVGNAVQFSKMWSGLITPANNWTPPAWLLGARDAMDAQCLANPRKASAADPAYLAAKLAFERPEWMPVFVRALQAGRDYIPKGIWDQKTGNLSINPKTGRIRQGVMAKGKAGYIWDTAGNAFQLNNGTWSSIPIETINNRQTFFGQLRGYYRELVPTS